MQGIKVGYLRRPRLRGYTYTQSLFKKQIGILYERERYGQIVFKKMSNGRVVKSTVENLNFIEGIGPVFFTAEGAKVAEVTQK